MEFPLSLYWLVMCSVLLIKTYITSHCFSKVTGAIYIYQIDMLQNYTNIRDAIENTKVDYTDMRSFFSVTFDLTSWTAKGVLPPEKYQIIEPYLKKRGD